MLKYDLLRAMVLFAKDHTGAEDHANIAPPGERQLHHNLIFGKDSKMAQWFECDPYSDRKHKECKIL